MTNLSLPSDPRGWVPRHTVAEWFQMKGVCRATGLWRSSFIVANSHFPSLANPLLVAKDGSASPDYPSTSCNWRRAARWRRHFFSPQNFRAPAKAVQSHVRARAPQREASVRLHYQMTPQASASFQCQQQSLQTSHKNTSQPVRAGQRYKQAHQREKQVHFQMLSTHMSGYTSADMWLVSESKTDPSLIALGPKKNVY